MSYDSKCADLAKAFLDDVPGHTDADVARIAQLIQNVIEDELRDLEEAIRHAEKRCSKHGHYLCADHTNPPRECLAQPGQCGRST